MAAATAAAGRADRPATSTPTNSVQWDEHTDVLVVGGGGAGLVAAIAAREHGADVLLLEKAASLGGNTKASGASMQAAGTPTQRRLSISDSPADHRRFLLQAAEGAVDPGLVEFLASEGPAAIGFMASRLGEGALPSVGMGARGLVRC